MPREEAFRNERPSEGKVFMLLGLLGETSHSKKSRERPGSDSLVEHLLEEHPNLRDPYSRFQNEMKTISVELGRT